eukprot:snap_masked-scaffold_36-processed-gene-2.102-mRNA-1 protein AED:1.00 eAED:1.00 QI:0/0/0/0/1/1/2/0/805
MKLFELAKHVFSRKGEVRVLQRHYVQRLCEAYETGIYCCEIKDYVDCLNLMNEKIHKGEDIEYLMYDVMFLACIPFARKTSFEIVKFRSHISKMISFFIDGFSKSKNVNTRIVSVRCLYTILQNGKAEFSRGNYECLKKIFIKRKIMKFYAKTLRKECDKYFEFDSNDNGFISAREYAEANDVRDEENENDQGNSQPIFLLEMLKLGSLFIREDELLKNLTPNIVQSKALQQLVKREFHKKEVKLGLNLLLKVLICHKKTLRCVRGPFPRTRLLELYRRNNPTYALLRPETIRKLLEYYCFIYQNGIGITSLKLQQLLLNILVKLAEKKLFWKLASQFAAAPAFCAVGEGYSQENDRSIIIHNCRIKITMLLLWVQICCVNSAIEVDSPNYKLEKMLNGLEYFLHVKIIESDLITIRYLLISITIVYSYIYSRTYLKKRHIGDLVSLIRKLNTLPSINPGTYWKTSPAKITPIQEIAILLLCLIGFHQKFPTEVFNIVSALHQNKCLLWQKQGAQQRVGSSCNLKQGTTPLYKLFYLTLVLEQHDSVVRLNEVYQEEMLEAIIIEAKEYVFLHKRHSQWLTLIKIKLLQLFSHDTDQRSHRTLMHSTLLDLERKKTLTTEEYFSAILRTFSALSPDCIVGEKNVSPSHELIVSKIIHKVFCKTQNNICFNSVEDVTSKLYGFKVVAVDVEKTSSVIGFPEFPMVQRHLGNFSSLQDQVLLKLNNLIEVFHIAKPNIFSLIIKYVPILKTLHLLAINSHVLETVSSGCVEKINTILTRCLHEYKTFSQEIIPFLGIPQPSDVYCAM